MVSPYSNSQIAVCDRYRDAGRQAAAKVEELELHILPRLRKELGRLRGELAVARNKLDQILDALRNIADAGAACATSLVRRKPDDAVHDCIPAAIGLVNQKERQKQKIEELERRIWNKQRDVQRADRELRRQTALLAESRNYISNHC